MISVNELRKGNVIRLNNEIFYVVDCNHHKPGKGHAMVRAKLRNILKGGISDYKFGTSEKVEDVHIEKRNAQFSYQDGDDYYFMDNSTFEQHPVNKEVLGDSLYFLVDEMEVTLEILDEEIIGVVLPNTVVLEIEYTEKGLKGDTVSGATKPAKTSTGYELQVPLFVDIGDNIKIDTRTGEYIERA
jgi:elongation factor P